MFRPENDHFYRIIEDSNNDEWIAERVYKRKTDGKWIKLRGIVPFPIKKRRHEIVETING